MPDAYICKICDCCVDMDEEILHNFIHSDYEPLKAELADVRKDLVTADAFGLALKRELDTANRELEKWRTWMPDDEDLWDLAEQAKAKDGTYTDGLAAQAGYIGGLEARHRELQAELAAAQQLIAEKGWPVNTTQTGVNADGDSDWCITATISGITKERKEIDRLQAELADCRMRCADLERECQRLATKLTGVVGGE